MDRTAAVARLAALPHLRRLDAAILDRMAGLCRMVERGKGESVFLVGEPARAFFVVDRGGVRLYRLDAGGREQVVHRLGAGDSFAEAAVFNLGRYPVNAEATEAGTRLIRVDGMGFVGLLQAEPHVATAMVGNLCQRLFTLLQRVEELSAASAGARLARHLLSLPTGAGGSGEVELTSSKKELAARLAITPETLSRLLRRWREKGIVGIDGRRIAILELDVLEAVAEGADLQPPA